MDNYKKFNKGDICISSYLSRQNSTGISKRGCKVRIVRLIGQNYNNNFYSVFNLDFNRYEKLGCIYLELDKSEIRDRKIKELLS